MKLNFEFFMIVYYQPRADKVQFKNNDSVHMNGFAKVPGKGSSFLKGKADFFFFFFKDSQKKKAISNSF